MTFEDDLRKTKGILMYVLIRNRCKTIFIGDFVEVEKEESTGRRRGKTVVDVIKFYYPDLIDKELKGRVVNINYSEGLKNEDGNYVRQNTIHANGRDIVRLNMKYTIQLPDGKIFETYHCHLERKRQSEENILLEKIIKKEENLL